MDLIFSLIMLFVAGFFFLMFFKLITAPIKLASKLLINAIMGFFTLLIFNFFSGFLDFSLRMSFINCLVAGIFGTPGVVFLALLKIIF